MWGAKAKEVCGWEVLDVMMTYSTADTVFGDRLQTVHDLLPLVRFALLPFSLLEKLICNCYTLRHDGSIAYMRHWNFQGSLDGKTWTNLRVHENDQTICKPGQFASWPATGPNALLPFRFFRVVLTGPTMDASNPWKFCICFLELWLLPLIFNI